MAKIPNDLAKIQVSNDGYSAVGRHVALQSFPGKVCGLNSRGCFWAVPQAKIEIFGWPKAIGPRLASKWVVRRARGSPSDE